MSNLMKIQEVLFVDKSKTRVISKYNVRTLHSHGVVLKLEDGSKVLVGNFCSLSPEESSKTKINFRLFLSENPSGIQYQVFGDLFHESTLDEYKSELKTHIDDIYSKYLINRVNSRLVFVRIIEKDGSVQYLSYNEGYYSVGRKPELMKYESVKLNRVLDKLNNDFWIDLNKIEVVTVENDGFGVETYFAEHDLS